MAQTREFVQATAEKAAVAAFDCFGEECCPVAHALDFIANMEYEEFDGDDIAAEEAMSRVRDAGNDPQFGQFYLAEYARLLQEKN